MNNLISQILEVAKLPENERFLVDDEDFNRYFDFNMCDQYCDDILEYVDSEFISGYDDFTLDVTELTKDPILIDMQHNKLYTLSSKSHHKQELALYNYIAGGNSIYTPMFLATNSVYAKKILILLYHKFHEVVGYNYILFRFLDWSSVVIGYYSAFNENSIPCGTKLSLPFTFNFSEQFFCTANPGTSKHKALSIYSQYMNQTLECQK